LLPGCFLALLLWLLVIPASAASPFARVASLQHQQVAVTALAVDVTTGKVLASVNPDSRLVPASLSKLFTAAVALHHWGSDKTFITRLYGAGKVRHGHLQGDLILSGGGDPGLVSEQLWTLVGQLQAQGIRHIDGNLLVDASLFGRQACQTEDRCQALDASQNAYNASLSSAGVNYGAWCVRVWPAQRVGQRAHVSTCPFRLSDVPLQNRVTTVAGGQSLSLQRFSGKQGDVLRVGGQIGRDQQPAFLYVSAGDAGRQAGIILRQQLALAGVTLSGHIRVVYQHQPDWKQLAQIKSEPLSMLIMKMLNYSNNYMADVLTLDLLADVAADEDSGKADLAARSTDTLITTAQATPQTTHQTTHQTTPQSTSRMTLRTTSRTMPLTLAAAGEKLLAESSDFLAPMALKQGPVMPSLASGSGLSLENRLSARDLVTLLQKVYADTAIFPAFVGALTVPAFSPLGILRGPEPAWQARVMVKSGSLNEPHTVYGIAGYMRPVAGRWIAFAILLNGSDSHPHLPYVESMELLRQAVVNLSE
jgi:D-alanyl-D-alanine carboxypeptidase/D-alanyl-D-alanine-endopeptidase (penicillin-binding protein 4)